jgi:hypothetical protein
VEEVKVAQAVQVVAVVEVAEVVAQAVQVVVVVEVAEVEVSSEEVEKGDEVGREAWEEVDDLFSTRSCTAPPRDT